MQEVRLKMLEHSPAVADFASGRDSFALKPSTVLPAAPLQAEAAFYSEYPWCLNAFPTIREVADHLCGELRKLDRAQEDWQQSEVVTNIFLLSCALVDTIDDYLAGSRYDFSKIHRLLPFANS